MNKSESITELAKALNQFQAQVSGAKKKANNPFFKSKYADLEEVINCAKDGLSDNGLSISQFPIAGQGVAGVNTILMHDSGEWMEQELLLSVSKNDPQGMGSAITYARRYAYQAVLGIPSEDDDGARATRPTQTKPVAQKSTKPSVETIIKSLESQDTLTGLNEKWSKVVSLGMDKDKKLIEAYKAMQGVLK